MRNGGRRRMGQIEEVRARRAQEAGSPRSLTWDRKPVREMRTMAIEPSKEHDDCLMSIAGIE
jgi:hypothetical protein